jgi:hypothetical protein
LRIVYGQQSGNTGSTAVGNGDGSSRIYRNGSAVGTVNTIASGGTTWTEYSEDISGWAAGDLLQLYGKYNSDANGLDLGAMKIYENVPATESFASSAGVMKGVSNIYYGDIDIPTNLGAVGDIYIKADGRTYVKTGASTWTQT